MKKSIFIALLFTFQVVLYAQQNKSEHPIRTTVKGQGKPVIFIPGLGCSGDVWKETMERLYANYECHIINLPGFAGEKPMSLKEGYLPAVKNILIHYIQSNLKEKPMVIGHSFGGFLSLLISAENDRFFSKIIIVDSYPFLSAIYNPEATEDNVKSHAFMMKNTITASNDSLFIVQQSMTLNTMISDQEKIQLALQWSLKSDRETLGQAMYELMTTDLRDQLKNIQTPVLVLGSWIAGKDFGITKELTKAIFENQYANAPNVQIKISDAGRHFLMWDDFDWFIQEITNFLR